ncbi:MAG TPA: hydrogenase maturation protease [Candidatus Limnocylindrales bacterium]|nr:hydrogenase maturation protease [Candidatus Limnocylindrales bacterium]
MTALLPTGPFAPESDVTELSPEVHHLVTIRVEILACGAPDRGDDGAAIAAVARLADAMPEDVRIRIVGQLDIDDLLAVPAGAGAIVVDTAVGIDPGWIVEIPFRGLAGRESGIRPRSSHALSIPETIGVASMIRGRPLEGIVVAIGGVDFGLGDSLSWPVIAGMDAFTMAIADAVRRVRESVVRVPVPRR